MEGWNKELLCLKMSSSLMVDTEKTQPCLLAPPTLFQEFWRNHKSIYQQAWWVVLVLT